MPDDTAPCPLIRLDHASKRYGAIQALADVDLAVHRGEIVALLGPNGAGKTTAMSLLLGLLRPDSGRALAFGGAPDSYAARRRLGVMLQISGVPATLTVAEHIALFASYYPQPRATADVVRAAGLGGLEKRRFGNLSGGQKQRVLFALALCGDPEMLLLDEPTVGLDVEARRALWQEIRTLTGDRRRGVLLATHNLEEADALADRVIVIHHGRIVAEGEPGEIKARTSGRIVRCSTRLTDDELASLPGVEQVQRHGATVELLTRDGDRLVRALLARDAALGGLEITGAALEDAFLALTTPTPSQDTRTEVA